MRVSTLHLHPVRRAAAAALFLAAAVGGAGCGEHGSPAEPALAAASAPAPASSPCGPNERRLEPSGLCAARVSDACYEAAIDDAARGAAAPDSAPASGAGDPIRIRIINRTDAPLYFPSVLGARRIAIEVRAAASDAALTLPDTLFCPTLCPASGPVMEVDCGAPIPAMFAVPPGATMQAEWSGAVAVEIARACGAASERRCHAPKPAVAGDYVLRVCAYAALSPPAAKTSNGLVDRSRPQGTPRCLDTPFRKPSAEEVTVAFG